MSQNFGDVFLTAGKKGNGKREFDAMGLYFDEDIQHYIFIFLST